MVIFHSYVSLPEGIHPALHRLFFQAGSSCLGAVASLALAVAAVAMTMRRGERDSLREPLTLEGRRVRILDG
jgi:hypothetical protein